MGAVLLDSQALCIQGSWCVPNVIWLCTRGYGKSTLAGLFVEAKGMLNPLHVTAIGSGSGQQSINTFTTLENLATGKISSMPGLTGLFSKEVVINNAQGNGFNHNAGGHSYELYNGSKCVTLNSNLDKRRGLRANLLLLDECAFVGKSVISVFTAFTVVNR